MKSGSNHPIAAFLKKFFLHTNSALGLQKYINKPDNLLNNGCTLIMIEKSTPMVEFLTPGFYTVMLGVFGKCEINLGAKKIEFGSSYITVLPAERNLSIQNLSPDFKAYLLLFTTDFLNKGLIKNGAMSDFLNVDGEFLPVFELAPFDFEDLMEKFNSINKEMEREDPFYMEMVRSYLMQVLFNYNRVCETCLLNFKRRNSRQFQLAHDFKNLVEKNYIAIKSVKEYADLLSITPKYLSECTNEILGNSAIYIIQQRILLESQLLLDYSKLSIKEIGHQLNFDNISHFSRFFRTHKGITPTEYRNMP